MDTFAAKLMGSTAVALVTAGISVPHAPALIRPGTVTLSATTKVHTHVDAGARGRSSGDVDVYRFVLYNKRIQARPLGHGDMVCTTITGSNIARVRNDGSLPVSEYGRTYIDQTGAATTADMLRTIPQIQIGR